MTTQARPTADGGSTKDSPSGLLAGVLLLFGGVLLVGAFQFRPITDPDVWWHLRLGAEFRSGMSLSSPTGLTEFATEPWAPTQWLPEVLASSAQGRWGNGVLTFAAALAVLILALVLWRGNRRFGPPVAASVGAVATLVGTVPVLAPRPQVASLILLAVTANAWWRTWDDVRPRWWLVPLTWLWACTHGFWFVGAGLGVVFAAGLWLDHRVGPKQTLQLLSVPAASVVTAALTPVGPQLLLAPWRVSNVRGFIAEWQPPEFTSLSVFVVAVMAVVVVIGFARRRRVSWTEIAVLIVALALLVYAARTVALAAVLLSPLFAGALASGPRSHIDAVDRREGRLLAGGGAVLILIFSVAVATRGPWLGPLPPDIDRALSRLPPGTVVFNSYALGGWLSWQHPHVVHGVDGLTESFSYDYLESYLDAERLLPGWREFVDEEVDAQVLLLRVPTEASEEALASEGWQVIARSAEHALLGRSEPVTDE